MIGRIAGILAEKNPPQILVDVNGVGYELDVPMSTYLKLPDLSPDAAHKVSLHTHLIIKEDSHSLYGFSTTDERTAFRELLRVSGIGARTALAILSGMSVDELGKAIAAQDTKRLVNIPGIGAKTAERLVIELKTRFAKAIPPKTGAAGVDLFDPGIRSEAIKALVALGYSEKEASGAVNKLPDLTSVTDALRQGLAALAKR